MFYRTGTIALINGSASVVGTGTDFINGAAIGECVQAPDGKLYEILSIQSATALTLGQAYLGATASGQSYSIVPTQSYIRDLANQAATLVNSYSATNAQALKTSDADKTTPADADRLGMRDSVSGTGRLLLWSNLKTSLKTYFDSVTQTLTNKTINLASNTLTGTAAQFNAALSDGDFATQAAIDLKAPLVSPALTGTPTVPTAAASTSSNQIASTAFSYAEAQTARAQAVADVGDSPIHTNPRSITADFTLGSGYNGWSAGPIHVRTGVTVHVEPNATWTVP